eukprot:1665252-Prymnesium_polylepis.1
MYNCPRAASVKCDKAGVLWGIDRKKCRLPPRAAPPPPCDARGPVGDGVAAGGGGCCGGLWQERCRSARASHPDDQSRQKRTAVSTGALWALFPAKRRRPLRRARAVAVRAMGALTSAGACALGARARRRWTCCRS